MGDADDFSRDPIAVSMDSSRINQPTSSGAASTVADFHKKVVTYDHKNFPATNQNTFCWQKYNEYLHCMVKTKRDEDKCEKAKLHYMTVCPNAWTSMWDDQREAGVFLGVPLDPLAPELGKHHH
mmetsp:Transcript_8802/g.14997  ORF Transcript_8802/g.14997 Transcript_8802/m.14997 type:complete len:124 (+) Transcript_8802:27-398(+)